MEGVRLDTEMSFAILGLMEIRGCDETVKIAERGLCTLLGLLLLDTGQTVSVDRLAVGLWKDHPPNAVGNALRTLVFRLRAALADQREAGTRARNGASHRSALDRAS
jgi:DNA-binding SARP family transcriptional activator